MCTQKPNTDVAAGQPIPGSKYVRAFCRRCGCPMRVSKEAFELGCYTSCADCLRPLHPGHGTQGSTGEYDGAWDNAVRAIEDCQ